MQAHGPTLQLGPVGPPRSPPLKPSPRPLGSPQLPQGSRPPALNPPEAWVSLWVSSCPRTQGGPPGLGLEVAVMGGTSPSWASVWSTFHSSHRENWLPRAPRAVLEKTQPQSFAGCLGDMAAARALGRLLSWDLAQPPLEAAGLPPSPNSPEACSLGPHDPGREAIRGQPHSRPWDKCRKRGPHGITVEHFRAPTGPDRCSDTGVAAPGSSLDRRPAVTGVVGALQPTARPPLAPWNRSRRDTRPLTQQRSRQKACSELVTGRPVYATRTTTEPWNLPPHGGRRGTWGRAAGPGLVGVEPKS